MSKMINILIAIDTDSVGAIQNPSQDPQNPTGIAHSLGYMIGTGTTINSGQGTGDLSIQALVGDTVRVFGTSGSNNFEDAVLVYGLPKFGGDKVLGTFSNELYTKSTVLPGTSSNPLPPTIKDEEFWFYEADVVNKGTENYSVQFGLWKRDPGTGQPVLYGYFGWDPQITVAG